MLAASQECTSFIAPVAILTFWLLRWAMRSSADSAGTRRENTFRPRPPARPPPPEEEIEVDPGWDQGDAPKRPDRSRPITRPPNRKDDEW